LANVWYDAADVVCQLSRWEVSGEAGGFVLSEAMGCGTPIIGSCSGVISECVLEGKTGLLATRRMLLRSPMRSRNLRKMSRCVKPSREQSRTHATDINLDNTVGIYASLYS
jgi:glycosyltransferase involved in cell wall biosynthesis